MFNQPTINLFAMWEESKEYKSLCRVCSSCYECSVLIYHTDDHDEWRPFSGCLHKISASVKHRKHQQYVRLSECSLWSITRGQIEEGESKGGKKKTLLLCT